MNRMTVTAGFFFDNYYNYEQQVVMPALPRCLCCFASLRILPRYGRMCTLLWAASPGLVLQWVHLFDAVI